MIVKGPRDLEAMPLNFQLVDFRFNFRGSQAPMRWLT